MRPVVDFQRVHKTSEEGRIVQMSFPCSEKVRQRRHVGATNANRGLRVIRVLEFFEFACVQIARELLPEGILLPMPFVLEMIFVADAYIHAILGNRPLASRRVANQSY